MKFLSCQISLLFFVYTLNLINAFNTINQLNVSDIALEIENYLNKEIELNELKDQDPKNEALHRSFTNCALCKTTVYTVRNLAYLGNKNLLINTIRRFCILLKIETAEVCEGIVRSFEPEFLSVINNVNLSSGQICTFTLGNTCNEKIDQALNWTLTLPPKINKIKVNLPSNDKKTYKFLQISDTHVDLKYKKDSNAFCNEPLCCRSESRGNHKKMSKKLIEKSLKYRVKINDDDKAGEWGSYGSCDIPMKTFDLLLKQISKNDLEDIDYVIWTGDVPAHDVWRQNKEQQISLIQLTVDKFLNYLNGTKIYPALGNHEGFPVNSFPPKGIIKGETKFNMDWLYTYLTTSWTKWLPEETINSVSKGAYYSVKVKENLRIISLNTNYCNEGNWWLLINSEDPEHELTWLINELYEAEKSNEYVHIIGHIPPGKKDCLEIWSENYYRIVSRFKDTIKGQFFGHTHADEFEIFFDYDQLNLAKSTKVLTDLDPISVAYLAPSVTTFKGINPGYRIYEVDAETYEIINFKNYYLDLVEANILSENDPSYQPNYMYSYSPIEKYDMKDLSPKSWLDLVKRMKDDLNLTNLYIYLGNSKAMSQETLDNYCADYNCIKNVVCGILTAKSHDDEICEQVLKRLQKN